MRCLLLITTICLVLMSSGLSGADAKKKKYVGENGGDFEFIDEINKNSQVPSKSSNGERKRWIHDPTSDLCRPLNCKKREICLLEDEYSAVCVSKRDLHKNRDEIITKAKYLEEEAAKRRANKENNNNNNNNINNNSDNENDDEDAKNFSSDEESREDDVFYENNNTAGDKDDEEDEDNCKPCPVAKPTFLCGADNRTYSSLCRLDYHNCIHSTTIRIACKGFCPCKENTDGKRLQRLSERQSAFNAKYKKTIEQQQQQQQQQQKQQMQQQLMYKDNSNSNNILGNTNDNLDNTLNSNNFNAIMDDNQYPEDKHKIRGYNEVVEKPQKYSKNSMNNGFLPSKSAECKPQQLTAIGNRLLDWFSVIMADSKKRRQHSQKSKAHFPPACKTEAKWMFGHLDLNNDGYLSLQEMYDLEHDQNERCIKPFIDTCDLDQDNSINTREWCRCFEKTDRPCAAVRRRIAGDFAGEIGAYAPDCDIQGFYKPTQCHNSVGVCWCVDKHGVEFANTRTRGKPNCESVVNNASSLTSDDEDEETEDDDDSAEGSADQMLVF
ncbi:proteoglycan Cow isoform X3 [Zeugodacus cucurbitae]|uniref:proteoglycan Cow isoform X3 n=1 Tax=Zeugodacus cucurbitae TaxID=28588 RepID=UPI0005968389|nr:proteoglycan Cow isoform X3 [Zeugodacus cucurbitae]